VTLARIDREAALAEVAREMAGAKCAVCRALSTNALVAELDDCAAYLNRFPVRWGHVVVVPRRHVESFVEMTDAEHAAAGRLTTSVARAIETTMRPNRVFVAALGSARDDLPMTTAHMHWHVVPVDDERPRPRDVFTWEHGVMIGDADDWAAVTETIRHAIAEFLDRRA
jgi:diadenosine tetraphosphate (Ap4A) HIT family hydrolase